MKMKCKEMTSQKTSRDLRSLEAYSPVLNI